MSDDGGSAFPRVETRPDGWGGTLSEWKGGMSLRDYFAGQALAGLIAKMPLLSEGSLSIDYDPRWPPADDPHRIRAGVADGAYAYADAMFLARAQKPTEQP